MIFLLVPTCYLLGSIPFSFIIAKIWGVDLRRVGSGNIGATNVLRSAGLMPGVLAFFFDFAKGWGAVLLGSLVSGDPLTIILLGSAALLGHTFPVFLKFRGGKGAATGFGILAGITPDVFGLALLLVAIIIYATRYVSLASIITPWFTALLMYLMGKPAPYLYLTVAAAIFILVRHLPNIKRLINGTEPRIGENK
ncbi:acyl-phosphate glycerol 3-phosphate acyltransferase [candidate division WOR-1 bacterium RIFOXYA12_FULL_52_29]|uniref:Glycerol-3-phosphate acyltransferase n=1 Tax=candidate division WOR-1 bacterium RIFOXYC12_FULL_54_18 TaxID=1802584 RepID=A0A1F4T5W1_UNCSA|nr:MAG: acyl-phosphate glycerol 3-phosphate acyltransferase [candidate division WOR-1 bacterium RIFOXYA2_FULL_51_19]OGC17784.1 MAG: acyl-phosphate glycerol 3-phosphate acyltransferase [candidate division WOR-1 bacterium RIFOXYA12_FULL_52_29]OGC26641.1 MAG: acyl-phosphate glycerol 3-phosphate acyltransferase [candidate division WOR-1 bacterium RIFOXYB2_FULL_45_9]OGC28201.1 MAG: acyl-phosphate glycerol 3-phosphate acyltransferase [candidate division WOR-1 bacterium RIFOXYC12_FULL_54_18]OGC29511.1